MGKEPRRAGRPTRPVLNRQIIAEEALAFVTESGLERLTMSRLAKELGMAPSALYNHLDNKADLVLLIQEALMSQVSVRGMVGVIASRATLKEALEEWARSYRKVFAKYPSLIPLIAVTPVSDAPQSSRMYNVVAQALTIAGVPKSQVISVVAASKRAHDEREPLDQDAETLSANNVYADHPFRFGLSALIASTVAMTGQPAAAD